MVAIWMRKVAFIIIKNFVEYCDMPIILLDVGSINMNQSQYYHLRDDGRWQRTILKKETHRCLIVNYNKGCKVKM